LKIIIPANYSKGQSKLPTWLFLDSYMGYYVPDRLLGYHLLGTDAFERDVLSRLIYSARPTALVSMAAMVISMLIGVPIGLFAGFQQKWTERTLMRVSDIFSAFPRFFLIIAIVALWGQNILLITIAIGITGWMGPARFINAKTQTLMEQDYILAAQSTGRVWWRIIIYDLLPNIFPHIFVLAAYGAGIAVLLESSLSYVHLGVAEPAASWGNMLAHAHTSGAGSTGMERMWQVLSPGLAIAFVVISFNFLADGLKQTLRASNV
jgi:peptide/nickel transport system permease protein